MYCLKKFIRHITFVDNEQYYAYKANQTANQLHLTYCKMKKPKKFRVKERTEIQLNLIQNSFTVQTEKDMNYLHGP